MNRYMRHLRRILYILAMLCWLDTLTTIGSSSPWALASAQAVPQDPLEESDESLSPATKKFREMSKPEAKAKAKADLERPPFEFLRSQISPFDVLPYYKHNHWMYMTIEARSSREDFRGSVRTQPLSLFGSQRELIYERAVSMERNTPTRMSFPLFVPPRYMEQKQTKLFDLDLFRESDPRPTEIWQSNVRAMGPHQMAVVILAREPSTYTGWTKMMAGIPSSTTRDSLSIEQGRYYRFVLPENPEKPLLAPSFLFWTNISHLIWDGFDPNQLDVDQQRALVDWLHWGGQITILGGADSRLGLLRESVLAPYLPADLGGTNRQLATADLNPLAAAYRPPFRPVDSMNEEEKEALAQDAQRANRRQWAIEPGPANPYYDPASSIVTPDRTPVFFSSLQPRPGATVIPFGTDDTSPLAVEWRVGRGRITILALTPTDPSLTRWRGLDTLVRRVVLRRPEEALPPARTSVGNERKAPIIAGPDLTWLRIAARDTGGPVTIDPTQRETTYSPAFGASLAIDDNIYPKEEVATWTDASILPTMAREQLEKASGINIPEFSFVAKSLAVYLILLVPLNWLIFKTFGRKELAWLVVPVLALSAALVIERLAAYDLGFTRGRDEIALLEIQTDYPRGHLSRFGALAATGRDTFQIGFPNDLNAVCLPQAYSASRADESQTSTFSYTPLPTLSSFQVQPRSLSFYRSEQMVGLPGPIRMIENGSDTFIENRTKLNLHNVVITGPQGARFAMGELGAGQSRLITDSDTLVATESIVSRKELLGDLDPEPFLNLLADNPFKSAVDLDGWRLVGWSDAMIEGTVVEPAPDRVRGFTLVIAHLKSGPTPNPAESNYNRLAASKPMNRENTALPPNHPAIGSGMLGFIRNKANLISARSMLDNPSQSNNPPNESAAKAPATTDSAKPGPDRSKP